MMMPSSSRASLNAFALVGADRAVDPGEFLHQRLVDRQPPGGVEDHGRDVFLAGPGHARLADGDRIGGRPRRQVGGRVHRHAELLAEHDELLDGGGPLKVGGHEQHAPAGREDLLGELGRGGRFAGALQAAQHEHRRAAGLEVERVIHRAHELDELVVHDPDELLGGVERLEHLLADGLGRHPLQELVGHVVGDVGLQERRLDLLQALPHVAGGELAAAAERVDGRGERGGERFEHESLVRIRD
jgi:hypothetical protein